MAEWTKVIQEPNGVDMTYIQQGDVLLFEENIPTDLVSENTNIVQHGKATGHSHRLPESETVYVHPKTKERYLKLVKPAILKHEEHNPIEIPPGTYRIGIVKEYDHFLEESRNVAD